jgi:hypothetical protein
VKRGPAIVVSQQSDERENIILTCFEISEGCLSHARVSVVDSRTSEDSISSYYRKVETRKDSLEPNSLAIDFLALTLVLVLVLTTPTIFPTPRVTIIALTAPRAPRTRPLEERRSPQLAPPTVLARRGGRLAKLGAS